MGLLTKHVAVLTLAAGVALAGAGCQTRDEMRPDMDKVVSGDHGPQSRDLREMASRLAPDLLQCNDITHNQFRVTIVMKDMANKTDDPGKDMNIYVAKLTSMLNTGATADRLLFVEQQATLRNMQAQELGGGDPFGEAGRTQPPPDPRIVPQYALYGEVRSMNNGKTSYYLFTFHMTNLTSGAQSWNGSYEVRTLN